MLFSEGTAEDRLSEYKGESRDAYQPTTLPFTLLKRWEVLVKAMGDREGRGELNADFSAFGAPKQVTRQE